MTWQDRSAPTDQPLHHVWGRADGPWIVSGSDGVMFRSDDRGLTWLPVTTPVSYLLWRLSGDDPDARLYAIGSGQRGACLLRAKRGRMRRLKIGRQKGLRGLLAFGETVYLLGSNAILKSRDGGDTFTAQREGYLSYRNLHGFTPERVFAIGYNDILRTTDGGDSWRKLVQPVQAHLSELSGHPDEVLYGVGAWDVIASRDGGDTWEALIANRRTMSANSVCARSAEEVVVVGRGGLILRATDGATFQSEDAPDRRDLRAVASVDPETLVAVGDRGAVLVRDCAPRPHRVPAVVEAVVAPAADARAQADAEAIRAQLAESHRPQFAFLNLKDIRHLDALAEFPDIEDLHLYGSARSLEVVRRLPKLRSITLRNKAPDLAPLTDCPALTTVDLSECSSADLAPLAGCSALEHLHLPRHFDPAQLTALPPLQSLHVNHGWETLADTPVQTLRLVIKHPKVDSLQPFAHLSALESLAFYSRVHLSDLSPLRALTHLQQLTLSSHSLTDLTPLAGLTDLEGLDLDGCKALTDVTALASLTRLKSLDLSETQVADLSPLSALEALEHLNLSRTRITDLAPLSGLPALRHLRLFECSRLRDISSLRSAPALSDLSLSRTRVRDLSPLTRFPDLTGLSIEKLGDVSGDEALRSLTHLISLELEETTVDIDHLLGLPELKFVRGTPWPPPGHEPTGPFGADTLGPGLIFAGRARALKTSSPREIADLDLVADRLAVGLSAFEEAGAEVYDLSTDPPERLLHIPGFCGGAALTTSGDALYTTRKASRYDHAYQLICAPLDGSEPRELGGFQARNVTKIHRSRGGRYLAIEAGHLWVWDVEAGDWLGTLASNKEPSPESVAHFLDDHRLLVVGHEVGQITLHALPSLDAVERWEAPYETALAMTSSDDGRLLAVMGSNNYGADIYDLSTGERLLTEHVARRRHLGHLVITPDGSLLVQFGRRALGYRVQTGAGPAEGPCVPDHPSRRARVLASAVSAARAVFAVGSRVIMAPLMRHG